MVIETENGLKILKGQNGYEALFIDSSRIEDCISYLYENNLKRISINPFQGFHANDLGFLSRLEDYLEGITILDEKYDYTIVNHLHKLKSLGILDNKRDAIDLSNFPHLESLSCDYSPRLKGLEACEELRSLTLTNFKPEKADLSPLPVLTSLQSLSLFVTNIDSLAGIERFRHLESCSIYRASKLESIAALSKVRLTLKSLELDSCKNIKSYDALSEVVNLERLIISKSAPLKSVKFVKSLDRLDFFSFVGTNVEDGDLLPSLGVSYVGFDDRKHYNLKFKGL